MTDTASTAHPHCAATMPPIRASLAVLPGLPHATALASLHQAHARGYLAEPLFGPLAVDHVQLVPQGVGRLDPDSAAALRARYPGTRLRLHANVRVLHEHQYADLSTWSEHADWFHAAAEVHQALGADAYTAHSGRRCHVSLVEMLDNARRCADLFGCPVGVEGQYPKRDADGRDEFLVSTWTEYRQLFESGVPYALDLSHLQIVRQAARRQGADIDLALLHEMLACERCLEVHVSDNDGLRDSHWPCTRPTWWFDLLGHVHPAAIVFSEGNQRHPMSSDQGA